ncbi:MAG TPA: LysR family transcriptional regulator [Gaiellaceae bacterium]|jgi:DNA-binding transcriptional LysR family regulator|nr:LysR family transcriptional regulator [Gaiellaceae bacterium]
MELRDLRAFAAVLELRGMTRAARRLHVVQSAVSQAVKRLEQEFGLQLLERRPDGVHPTPAGEALGRFAERILDNVALLEDEMASYRGHARGVVNVGVVSTLAVRLVAPLVRAVDAELPDVTLRIKEGIAGDLLESLRLGRLDLVAVVSPVDGEDMKVVSTGQLRLNFVLRPDHRLADRREIAFAEVAEEQWVTFPKSNPARRWLDDNSRKAGFRPVISAEIETFTQMKAFVEAGHGIALAPAELIDHELRLGLLRAIPSIEPHAAIGIGYAYDESISRQPAAAIQKVLEEQLRRLVPRERVT